MNTLRLAACVAGLWAGLILGIGLIGAPAAFASVAPEIAGRVAGRMFMQEAYLSLAVSVFLLWLVRSRARVDSAEGRGSVFSANVVLVLGALFCTVFGYFAIQPMMAAARLGQGALPFGVLHGVSASLFALKGLLALALSWRLSTGE